MSQHLYNQLSSGQPVEVELLYPLATYNSRSKAFYLRSEIDEDFWNAMRALEREGLRLRAVIQIQPDDEGASVQARTPDESANVNSGNPDANSNASTKGKKEKKAPRDERTIEQQINGQAWSTLLYHTPEFVGCPGVIEDHFDHYEESDGADPKPAFLRAFGKARASFISEDEALTRYINITAQQHIRAAWRAARAKIRAKQAPGEEGARA